MNYSLRSYSIGFALSLALTFIPYFLVTHSMLSRPLLIACIVLAALIQLVIQLGFFLHVNLQQKERPRLHTFIFTAFMVVVVVAGSLWIMHDLNYFMMDPIMELMPDHGGHMNSSDHGAHGHH